MSTFVTNGKELVLKSEEKMLTKEEAKRVLKAKGWTYREAAPRLGIHPMSLFKILNGIYSNQRVLREIEGLEAMKRRKR